MSNGCATFLNTKSRLVLGDAQFEPVTASELSIHSHVDSPDGQELLSQYLMAARAWVENDCKLALSTRTATLYLDSFPLEYIEVRMPPLVSVSSITYVDYDGSTQTLSSSLYRVDAAGRPGRITPVYGNLWPNTPEVTNAVTVTATVGYASASAVPEAAKQAIRFMAGLFFEQREPMENDLMVVRRILDPIRWDGSL